MKAHYLSVSLILIFGLLSGCGNDRRGSESVSFSAVTGVWKNELTGEILHVENTGVSHYHATNVSCIATRTPMRIDDADDAYYEIIPSEPNGDFLHIYPEELNLAEDHVFKKQEGLPAFCETAGYPSAVGATAVFEHLWHTIDAYYPFLEKRQIDWHAQYSEYIAQASDEMSEDALFVLLAEMLSAIDDSQIELIAKTAELDAGFNPAKALGWHRIAERVAALEDVPYDVAYQFLVDSFNQVLEETYASSALNVIANNSHNTAMAWARLEDKVAYLQVNTFEGYGNASETFSDKLNNFKNHIESILANLNDTSGLIVDLRFNRGGEHELAVVLASYFSGTSKHAFLTQSRYEEGVNVSREFPENSSQYTQPVTIIVSSNTQGSAELFALSLLDLPHVTIIGDVSNGAMSPQFSLPIKEGWVLRFSYQEYFSQRDAQSFESKGIPVAQESPSSSYWAVDLNMLPSVHLALENMDINIDLSDDNFITLVEEIMGEDIPGFASAQISPTQINLHAFGYANLEEEEETTIDTPFKVGSISKTLIGTSATQMLEQGLIDLDWTLENIGFPIAVDGENIDNSTVTLRHLLTHTSGIADGGDYQCAYVIDEGRRSLTGAFDIYECPEPLTTDTPTYLEQYLQNDGVFFDSEENFTGRFSGESWQYSNVAASVAAESLHHVSGMPFDQWTHTHIFEPLGMDHTSWFNASYPDDALPAQPYALLNQDLVTIPRHSLATWADGDLRTTVRDLSRYFQAIINGGELDGVRILDQESVEFMLENQTNAAVLEDQGIFWFNDGIIMGHSGGDPGTMAHMYYDQFNQVGYITLVNISGEDDEAEKRLEDKFALLNYLVYRRALTAFKNLR